MGPTKPIVGALPAPPNKQSISTFMPYQRAPTNAPRRSLRALQSSARCITTRTTVAARIPSPLLSCPPISAAVVSSKPPPLHPLQPPARPPARLPARQLPYRHLP
jgi:hypothetical protein